MDLCHVAIAEFDVGAAEVEACFFEIWIVGDGVVECIDAVFGLAELKKAFAEIIEGVGVGLVGAKLFERCGRIAIAFLLEIGDAEFFDSVGVVGL